MNQILTERRADGMPGVSRTVVAMSPLLDLSIGIVVCIPSFRRPQHLRLTLESLVGQRTKRRFAVVVIENDAAKCESVQIAAEFLTTGKIAGLCVVEPRQGNCQAINAAFETALATFPSAHNFLMIDDDEIASPDWLERMVNVAQDTGADLVGGPVFSKFDDELKRDLRRHPAFCPAYDTTGPVPIIYGSGNCLITRAVFMRLPDPSFDLRFNFLGGGDTDFFVRCRDTGMKSYWAADAVITETVPRDRTKTSWLAWRGLRIGAINYQIQAKTAKTLATRLRLLGKMCAMLLLSPASAARLVLTERRIVFALHPMAIAAGSALAALGIKPQPYKGSNIAS